MINPMSLEGKRILITGASSGIGRASAILASKLGAKIVLVSRDAEKLQETLMLTDNPDSHICLPFDVTRVELMDDLFGKIIEGGKLNGFVHCAGINLMSPISFLNSEEINKVFEVNTFSFLNFMKFLSKVKYSEQGLSAVGVSSVAALSGVGGAAVYAGSKGALNSIVKSLARELAAKKMRVNTICASSVKTPLFDEIVDRLNDDAGKAKLLERQILGLGTPEQIANVVCFLLSDASSFITGANISADGGYLA